MRDLAARPADLKSTLHNANRPMQCIGRLSRQPKPAGAQSWIGVNLWQDWTLDRYLLARRGAIPISDGSGADPDNLAISAERSGDRDGRSGDLRFPLRGGRENADSRVAAGRNKFRRHRVK